MIYADLSTQRRSKKNSINLPSKIAISVFFSILFACILFFPQVSSASDTEQSLVYNSIAQDSGELFPYLLAANTHRQNPKRLKRKKGKNTHKKYQQSINQKFPEWRSKEEKKSLFKQTSKYGQHLKRNKVLTEGISSHEGGRNGGETVRNHVSVSEKSLISRIEHDLRQKAKAKDKKIDYKELKPELLSSFKSIKEADRHIDRVLADKNNQQKIKEWIKENSVLKADRSANNSSKTSLLDPNIIRFSQNTVSYHKIDRKTGKKFTFDSLVSSMKKDGWKGDPVDVVKMPDGKITSIDNTRILAAREAKIEVKARVRKASDKLTPAEVVRFEKPEKGFNPKTWGEAISGRINKQKPGQFGKENPSGTISAPRVKGKPK